MQRIIIGLFMWSCCLFTFGQTTSNLSLKKELDSIYTADQKYRQLLFSGLTRTKADSVAAVYKISKEELPDYLMRKMQETDSLNLIRIEQIIQQYGYPGQSLVGTPTNEAVFFVIQHSPNIEKHLPMIKRAADKKELPFKLYAMMLDRWLMYKGEEQIYGTQGKGLETMNAQTGRKEFKMIIWPIKDAPGVNKRRKEAGFEQTVEENAKRLGIEYKVFTLEDVKKMQSPN
ncbi:DUF6624 domain-containing protein [Chryseosolibacter indicus]|uniref:GLPGLI family protein n=1 Tax=Chryseosolibacter indicus TaxID=2782351 RepID=A0ABS5VNX7_9BACT|nr:DUF6624 domain-containing protein [Chryseosolibacter indicus]MBT1702545.1 hypothetical protein [Chryseosolibacter indicus]